MTDDLLALLPTRPRPHRNRTSMPTRKDAASQDDRAFIAGAKTRARAAEAKTEKKIRHVTKAAKTLDILPFIDKMKWDRKYATDTMTAETDFGRYDVTVLDTGHFTVHFTSPEPDATPTLLPAPPFLNEAGAQRLATEHFAKLYSAAYSTAETPSTRKRHVSKARSLQAPYVGTAPLPLAVDMYLTTALEITNAIVATRAQCDSPSGPLLTLAEIAKPADRDHRIHELHRRESLASAALHWADTTAKLLAPYDSAGDPLSPTLQQPEMIVLPRFILERIHHLNLALRARMSDGRPAQIPSDASFPDAHMPYIHNAFSDEGRRLEQHLQRAVENARKGDAQFDADDPLPNHPDTPDDAYPTNPFDLPKGGWIVGKDRDNTRPTDHDPNWPFGHAGSNGDHLRPSDTDDDPIAASAWKMLTDDMAGGLHQFDHWDEVPAKLRATYLDKAMFAHDRASTADKSPHDIRSPNGRHWLDEAYDSGEPDRETPKASGYISKDTRATSMPPLPRTEAETGGIRSWFINEPMPTPTHKDPTMPLNSDAVRDTHDPDMYTSNDRPDSPEIAELKAALTDWLDECASPNMGKHEAEHLYRVASKFLGRPYVHSSATSLYTSPSNKPAPAPRKDRRPTLQDVRNAVSDITFRDAAQPETAKDTPNPRPFFNAPVDAYVFLKDFMNDDLDIPRERTSNLARALAGQLKGQH